MEILNVSRGTVFNLLAEGKLVGHNDKPGRNGIRVTVKSVEDYIERYTLSKEYFLDRSSNIETPSRRKIISEGVED
jgi:hypothetical protein